MSTGQPAMPGDTTATTARSLHEIARLVPCGHCWARPGVWCTFSGPRGLHLARYQRAERKGLLSRGELAAVVATLEVIAPHVIVRGGAR